MRKLLLTCLLALGLSTLFSSCEKEGSYGSADGYANMILGEWVLEKVEGGKTTIHSLYFSYSLMEVTTHSGGEILSTYLLDERDKTLYIDNLGYEKMKILQFTSSNFQIKTSYLNEDGTGNPMTLYFKRKK